MSIVLFSPRKNCYEVVYLFTISLLCEERKQKTALYQQSGVETREIGVGMRKAGSSRK